MAASIVLTHPTYVDSITWSETTVTLKDIDEGELPQLVQIQEEDQKKDLGPGVNTELPFLVYSKRRRTKVYAECMFLDKKKKQLVVDGPPVEIPKDYTGWFEVFPSDGQQPRPYTTISDVTNSKCKKFLVRTTVHGFRFAIQDGDLVLERETKVYPGEVLEIRDILSRRWKVKDLNVNEAEVEHPETRFVKCIDHRMREICITLAHPGKFSPIYDRELSGSNPSNAVSQIADLLDSQFPIVVRLVLGWPPPLMTSRPFPGVLQLLGLNRPDSLVMCNVQHGKTLLSEVPTDMNIRLKTATNLDELQDHKDYQDTLKKCYSKVYSFVIGMKTLAVKYQKGSPTENRSYSRCPLPVDMDVFNPMDVYPPLEKDTRISEAFAISFKDPDNLYDSSGNTIREEEEWTDKQGDTPSIARPGARVKLRRGRESIALDFQNKKKGIFGKYQMGNASPTGSVRSDMGQMRAQQDKDLLDKEARC